MSRTVKKLEERAGQLGMVLPYGSEAAPGPKVQEAWEKLVEALRTAERPATETLPATPAATTSQ